MARRPPGWTIKAIRRWLVAVIALGVLVAVVVTKTPPPPTDHDGVGLRPAMGWSSWSFLRGDPTLHGVEAQADALVERGLARLGYDYVNLDDFWYQCPGAQGPAVDRYGRWVVDTNRFPRQGSVNGVQAVAEYVHHLGLKFGLYVTPGISKQAVTDNTAIQGTAFRADDIATTAPEDNYNCGGMVGINFRKPGAQAFINSWADELASWGVDYVKLDGVGSFDTSDVAAWSAALRQTGRPIHLELSNSLDIAEAATWAKEANGWRTGGDIECYCSSSSYPLTDWPKVALRFDQVADWAPYGRPGGYNDYDSIEVGNGAGDGLTPAERETQLSLWALGSSPLILGVDLTRLTATDLSYLDDRAVISVDQDGIDATRIAETLTTQVFAKPERNGDAVVGLFNLSSRPEVVSTTAASLGLAHGTGYLLDDLWTHRRTATTGPIAVIVPSHGVVLYRVRGLRGVPGARGRAGL
jgi:hypothetical protein